MDIDIFINVINNTILSPTFCAFIPLSFYGQVRSFLHPTVYLSTAWTALIIIIAILKHINRIYTNRSSWLLAPSKLDWSKQIVLITGGGSGIGALLAQTLAMRNVTTVVLSKDPVLVDPSNDDIVDSMFTYTCDVSNYKEVEEVAERIRKEIGDPTIIINNAGVVKGKLLLDLTESDIKDTFGSNTLAHFWVLKCFLPAILRNGSGHIVSIASLLGLVGCAQMTDYCSSKAAVIHLHQSLRFELDNRYMSPQIRTTLLLPSFVTTTLFSEIQLPRSRLWNFLAPPLHPHQIVKAIISALDEDESRTIRMPFYTNFARIWSVGVGIVPKWLVDFVQWISAADFAMIDYGPKPDAAEKLLAEKKSIPEK